MLSIKRIYCTWTMNLDPRITKSDLPWIRVEHSRTNFKVLCSLTQGWLVHKRSSLVEMNIYQRQILKKLVFQTKYVFFVVEVMLQQQKFELVKVSALVEWLVSDSGPRGPGFATRERQNSNMYIWWMQYDNLINSSEQRPTPMSWLLHPWHVWP